MVRMLRDTVYAARRAGRALVRPPASLAERERWEESFGIVDRLARRLLPGYVLADYGRSWQSDEEFARKIAPLEPDRRSWDRKYALLQLLQLVREVPGDTVEVGVFRGTTSWLICDALASEGRRHYAIDSYEGLSEPQTADGGYWRQGDMAAPEDHVRQLLAGFDADVVKGWVPQVLDRLESRQVAFVHVDVDLYEPTLASLEYFYPRLSPGGLLICDDYGFDSCPGARRAMDEFMAEHPEPVVHLPTGQGLVIRSA
jgi:O-methyltransferase